MLLSFLYHSLRVQRHSRITRTKELLWPCVHRRAFSFPRTRLAKDLKPRSTSRAVGKLEIARHDPRQLPFNSFPHSRPRSRQGTPHSIRPRGVQDRAQARSRADDRRSAKTFQNHRDSRAGTPREQSDHDITQRFDHSSDKRKCHRYSEWPHTRADVLSKTSQIKSEGDRSSGNDRQTSARTHSRSERLGRRFESLPCHRIHKRLPEFFHAVPTPHQPHHHSPIQSQVQLPMYFTSPPLMPGLLSSLKDVIGPDAQPTPIQTLSLKHLFRAEGRNTWQQFLLASETGSGKSIAYLLPVLQALKRSEPQSQSFTAAPRSTQRAFNPRALILAPTHELSRQLAGFAKALLHVIKLRVLCTSKANVKSQGRMGGTASKMSEEHEAIGIREGAGDSDLQRVAKSRPVDIMVGTPVKILEMVRGRGWDQEPLDVSEHERELDQKGGKIRPRQVGESEMSLVNVEWVVVDEADVLFDPDFQQSTRMLLADISAARGHPVPYSPLSALSFKSSVPVPSTPSALEYPFNLLLTSATIPSSLATYLDTHHPTLTRLVSPNLHHLPNTLQTEYVSWTGGNRNTDIEKRIRRVWAEDALSGGAASNTRSKVLVFCNKNTKVQDLGKYLEEKGIRNIALTGSSDSRKRGSNHHLDGFLRQPLEEQDMRSSPVFNASKFEGTDASISTIPAEEPHVIITTSLLSRGLDFSPAIRHVFIVDEPRNMIDFLHRAGRAGRAGERGKVVVFGKLKGRGSEKAREVRRKVGTLVAQRR